ncbi:MAG: GNAT family N-acetyltransferase [Clostridia bacterium]|nr:GNAT family N-acetyltransferase [Clostridia bacterium]
MDIIIKKAEERDLEDILRLQKLAFMGEARRHNDFSIAPLHQTIEEITKEAESSLILKAVLDKRIVGSARAYEKEGTCYIGRVIVHPEYENKGIGKRLMTEIEANFKDCRYELFTGYLSEKNIAFYEKLGYKRFKIQQVSEAVQLIFFKK